MEHGFAEAVTGVPAAAPAAGPTGMGGMAGAMSPLPPEVVAAQRPVANAEEFEQRKAGWLQFITQAMNDPTISRAIGMMGVSLMQPTPFGQTHLGHFGNAVQVGMGAFDIGRAAETKAARENALAGSTVNLQTAQAEGARARTATEKAALPGVEAESTVKVSTQQAQIDVAKNNARKIAADAKKAESAADLQQMETYLKITEANILAQVPESLRVSVKLDEFNMAREELKKRRAEIEKIQADTAKTKEETEKLGKKTLADLTVEQVNLLKSQGKDEEIRQFLTKSGAYASSTTSGVAQQSVMWGKLYDGIQKNAPDDPDIKGKTRDQYVRDKLLSAKQKDAVEHLIKFFQFGLNEEYPELAQELAELAAGQARSKGGKAAKEPKAPKVPGVEKTFVRDAKGNIGPEQ